MKFPNNKTLSEKQKKKLLNEMNYHFNIYLRLRSITPFINKDDLASLLSENSQGPILIKTAPIYIEYGYDSYIYFDRKQFDSDEKYEQYQDIGSWINRSFLVELKSIIDSYIPKWNECTLKDNDYFILLRECRNLFLHRNCKFNSRKQQTHKLNNEKALILYKKLFSNIIIEDEELNLSITDFVIPFYNKLVDLIKLNL
jgi:hypothetical protein